MRDVSAYVSPPEPIHVAELYAKSEQWKYEREVRVIRSLADCEDRGPGPRGFTVYTQQLPQAGIKSARLLSTNSVRASDSKTTVSLPATTTAFEAANIFARTSGYIEKRYVDIGDRVKAGALLAEITAPELDHQIAQAQATLTQNQATLQQTQASHDLADVTNGRTSKLVKQGWLPLQQGDNDRLTLAARCGSSGSVEYHRLVSVRRLLDSLESLGFDGARSDSRRGSVVDRQEPSEVQPRSIEISERPDR
jgi:biotin carboxyl carrier protein